MDHISCSGSTFSLNYPKRIRFVHSYSIVRQVLIATGVGQIRYLNRALMKFDSKIVIPTQFVLFNLSVITSSAVLYGDFRTATLHQMVTFFYGCGATFAGVFLLTWGNMGRPGGEGSIGREQNEGERVHRAQLILPSTPYRPSRAMPVLRSARSSVSLVGLSPAQRVLLVHPISPPRTYISYSPRQYSIVESFSLLFYSQRKGWTMDEPFRCRDDGMEER